ncbi:MAG: putative lipid II flippase FtsW [Gammaproteobacteria bacterium]
MSSIRRSRVAGKTLPMPAGSQLDPWLAGAALALVCLGLIMVTSASITSADRELGAPFQYLIRQTVYLGIGGVAALICYLVPLRYWERTSFPLLLAAFVLLLAVLIPGIGREVNGSSRWLPMGPVNVQVSEPARLMILIFVSAYVARRSRELAESLGGFLKPVAIVAAACVLLLMEPDFGAATVLLATCLGVLFAGGVRLRYFFSLAGVAVLALAALAVASPYRVRRLTAFLDPWADPFDAGFQLTQSLIAIGRGEWMGVGLGGSVQKLFYLPEAHTDFVFAVYAEELGLIGVIALVLVYGLMVWRTLAVSSRCINRGHTFAGCLSFGIGTWLGAQAAVNIAVNMGLLPTKGLTLPLVSFGGSSLVVCCAAIGLVLRANAECGQPPNRSRGRSS